MARVGSTVADVFALLYREQNLDTIKFVYVADTRGRLVGIVSLRQIFQFPLQTIVDTFMQTDDLVSVPAHHDDEEATHLALRHGLQSVPVTEHGKLIGIIPARHLLKIFKKDAEEDIREATAVPTAERRELDNVLEDTIPKTALKRLPWLFVGLLGGLGAASIIHSFEALLAAHIMLASFIPIVVYLSGAISAQIQMFYIRDLTVYTNLPMARYILRQSAVVIALGLLVSVALLFINSIVLNNTEGAVVISVATMAAIISAIITGIGVPFALSRILKDPASATPPLAIISSDLLSVFLYFVTASALLG